MRNGLITVKGGSTDINSSKAALNGCGCMAEVRPSLWPRVGSFRLRTQNAMSRPGMPTMKNAACQALMPNGAAVMSG